MKSLLSGLFVLVVCNLYAQKSPIKFGVIPQEDLKMTTYDMDTSAEAVMLTNYGAAYIVVSTGNAALVYERHVRIKILKKGGLHWADVSIPLYQSGSDEEHVTRLKASTYNL